MNIKKLTEQKNEALAKMQEINEAESFDKGAWNKAESEFEAIKAKLERAELLEAKSVNSAQMISSRFEGSGNKGIYNTAEKVYQPQSDDISLESYLNAAFNKPKTGRQYEAIQNSVTSDGYELPDRVAQQVIDKLREDNPVIRAGARTAVIEGGSQSWVRVNNNPTSVFHSELEEEDSDNTDIFGAVKMEPKTLMTVVEVARETLQDSVNAGEALSTALTGALNDKMITATFTGQGADAPDGLDSLVSQTQEYTNGSAPTYGEFVRANSQLYASNVSEDNRSFIYSPDVWEQLSLETDNNGRYQIVPEGIRNIAKYTSSGLPAGEAYAGDFSNLIYGMGLNITLEQYSGGNSANKFGTKFLAVMRYDMALTHPNAFIRIQEASV